MREVSIQTKIEFFLKEAMKAMKAIKEQNMLQ
jgi:hypothetical protein